MTNSSALRAMEFWTAYKPIPVSEQSLPEEEEDSSQADPERWHFLWQKTREWRKARGQSKISGWTIYSIVVLVALITLLSVFWVTSNSTSRTNLTDLEVCEAPSLRKEWRTLKISEREAYILAVKCLMESPSELQQDDNRTSRYDDFTYTHAAVGGKTHNTASFLPWHRMFISVFHAALREDCGYKGEMPYWDWVIDSAKLGESPIWDSTSGFGGNGEWVEEQGQQCVREGPFSNTVRTWAASNATGTIGHEPHCMSRIFRDITEENEVYEWLHDLVSPEKVEQTLSKPDYGSFFLWFQLHTHNAIPFFIRGEWASFQVPNDPVWFLHHTQVDRLWSVWQDRDISIRAREYFGPTLNSSNGAELDDGLEMGGLVPDGRVADYLDIRGKNLCYRYQV